MKELLERIDELFKDRLSKKTGWGKNEIFENYIIAKNQALVEYYDKVNKPTIR